MDYAFIEGELCNGKILVSITESRKILVVISSTEIVLHWYIQYLSSFQEPVTKDGL